MSDRRARSGGTASGRSRTIRFRSSLRNVVYDVLHSRHNWVETDGDLDWDIFWADTHWIHETFDHVQLQEHQRVNHFRNHYELTRKDLMVKNLKRAKKALEKEARYMQAASYDFFPQTFSLPSEYSMFVDEFKKSGGVWIMKPSGRAQGKGIFLVSKLSQMNDWRTGGSGVRTGGSVYACQGQVENYICQRYLDNPYLIGGKKFDLRLYALVTSFSPLVVYLYRSGFCRFSTTRFTMHKDDIQNNMIHLTNVAVQKAGKDYDARSGQKFALRDLKLLLLARHPREAVQGLFSQITELVTKALLAVQNTIIHDKHCFELYGYDVMIDRELKPWLLEVNASPSLTSDTAADHELKFSMLNDALDIIDMEQTLPANHKELQVGGFDLIWDGGPVEHRHTENRLEGTLLGAYNARLSEG
eukprot:CAMPEP_0118960834 /NCGR_PEP_ID=MMETSP1169-20130426/63839_1 /TAXON_ID=36882 /ORGANISM="Pyramimonas obovata, Strain CCMP722" /LENGTH=414 /DNA_ID=CAMNT_0006908987 /DNA_START=38 /DNA_END=1282 /DNA_ORIENTATION=-